MWEEITATQAANLINTYGIKSVDDTDKSSMEFVLMDGSVLSADLESDGYGNPEIVFNYKKAGG